MTPDTIAFDSFCEVNHGAKAPDISILMPLYGQARFVQAAIRSVLAQRAVVAEIIISDDASKDGCFALACEAVAGWKAQHGLPHRVVMRRGSQRLVRDHLALLVDAATSDIVFQAHGDDLSHPHRAEILARSFAALPQAVLLTSRYRSIGHDDAAPASWPALPSSLAVSRYAPDALLAGRDRFLIGAVEAWRRSPLKGFARLDMDFAACAHDRILPFRAHLAGEVGLIEADLILRRIHPEAWTSQMFVEPDTSPMFGWSLAHAARHQANRMDLDCAARARLIDRDRFELLSRKLDEHIAADLANMLTAFRLHTRAGRRLSWLAAP